MAGVVVLPALPLLAPHEVKREASFGVIVKPKALKPSEDALPVELEYTASELQRIKRDKIILEERSRGATDAEIYEVLRIKGLAASLKTIWNVRHSDKAVAFTEELERVQYRDIALLRAYALRDKDNPNLKALAASINARGKMIFCLKPKPEPVNVEVNVNSHTVIKQQHVLLAEYANIIQEASALNCDLRKVRVGEPVDSCSSASSDGKERSKSEASEIPSPA